MRIVEACHQGHITSLEVEMFLNEKDGKEMKKMLHGNNFTRFLQKIKVYQFQIAIKLISAD